MPLSPRPQLGLFHDAPEPDDTHVVSAHSRILANGTEVHVGEHLRWNRGKQGPRMRTRTRRAPSPVPQEQLGLFVVDAPG